MKGKKSIYFLLPAVLVIWALVIYRFTEGLGGEDNYVQQQVTSSTHEQIINAKYVYELDLEYPDPFLKNNKRLARSSSSTKQVTVSAGNNIKASPNKELNDRDAVLKKIGDYKYIGLIEKGGANKLALLSYQGNTHMLRIGDAVGDMVLNKLYGKDSIEVIIDGRKLFIKK